MDDKERNSLEVSVISRFEKPKDQRTVFANLTFRCFFSVISALVLGFNININNQGYFTAVFLFAIPLFKDYLGFKPLGKVRKTLRLIELFILFLVLIICVSGFLQIISPSSINGIGYITFNPTWGGFPINLKIKLVYVWYIILGSAFFTIVDNITYGKNIKQSEEWLKENGVGINSTQNG